MQQRSCDDALISSKQLHLKAMFEARMQAGSGSASR